MKKSRFNEAQIIAILKEYDAGKKVANLAREHGISEPRFYTWKSKYGGMDVSEAQLLKALDQTVEASFGRITRHSSSAL